MAVVMSMHWPEITKDHYDRTLKGVRWETEHPKGALFHVAWFAPDGFRVTDVWRSAEDFQRFSEQRLTPVTSTLDLRTQPNVQFGPAHRMFNPGVPLQAARKAKASRRPRKKTAARKARRSRRSKR
jgi:hypothetical protein